MHMHNRINVDRAARVRRNEGSIWDAVRGCCDLGFRT
jgi:hypothetical protein